MQVDHREFKLMSELIIFAFFTFGMVISIGSATYAIRKRSLISYALSILLPCLFSFFVLFLTGLAGDRKLDVSSAALGGLFFVASGWLYTWQFRKEEREAKLSQLTELEQRVTNDQRYIDEWQKIIMELDRDGHDSKEPRAFLEGLQQSKDEYLGRWDHIRKELEQ